jgi:hypothetical protein
MEEGIVTRIKSREVVPPYEVPLVISLIVGPPGAGKSLAARRLRPSCPP